MTTVCDTPFSRSGSDTLWTVCPVTLNALALLSDRALGHMLDQVSNWRSIQTLFEHSRADAHPDLDHLWRSIVSMTLRAWAHGRFTVELHLDQVNPEAGTLRFVDQDFVGIGVLPATVLTALHGRPLAAYCDHPVFHSVHFDEDDGRGVPRAPVSAIPVDGDLGTRIRATRSALLERYPRHLEKVA